MYVSPWERYSNQTATGVCRLPELAAELVRLPVDVIVATFTPCALAAKQATTTIPIVMAAVADPMGADGYRIDEGFQPDELIPRSHLRRRSHEPHHECA